MCGIWTYINLCCRLWYNCARMYIFICITCCVVYALICAVTASAVLPHSGAAVPHPAATANHVVHKLSFASCFTYLTQYAAPHRSMDVGGAPSLLLKYEFWLLMLIWEFNSLFTYLGETLHPWLKNLSIYFISFVSSNWVLINHQKGRDWKCNQALIVGFGDNDHVIRELMRFIKMTSREFIFEDATRNGGSSNYKCWWLQTKRKFKFFYILNLSIGKAVL